MATVAAVALVKLLVSGAEKLKGKKEAYERSVKVWERESTKLKDAMRDICAGVSLIADQLQNMSMNVSVSENQVNVMKEYMKSIVEIMDDAKDDAELPEPAQCWGFCSGEKDSQNIIDLTDRLDKAFNRLDTLGNRILQAKKFAYTPGADKAKEKLAKLSEENAKEREKLNAENARVKEEEETQKATARRKSQANRKMEEQAAKARGIAASEEEAEKTKRSREMEATNRATVKAEERKKRKHNKKRKQEENSKRKKEEELRKVAESQQSNIAKKAQNAEKVVEQKRVAIQSRVDLERAVYANQKGYVAVVSGAGNANTNGTYAYDEMDKGKPVWAKGTKGKPDRRYIYWSSFFKCWVISDDDKNYYNGPNADTLLPQTDGWMIHDNWGRGVVGKAPMPSIIIRKKQ